MQEADLEQLAVVLGNKLQEKDLMLAAAESCTGGWIAKLMTDVPGSSRWFERGFVTYSNSSKMDMLGVRQDSLDLFGAVSEQVVRQMVAGALQHSQADVALAVSGVAGPGGGVPNKPVGTVWIAWAMAETVVAERCWFPGNRNQVRCQTVVHALSGMEKMLEQT